MQFLFVAIFIIIAIVEKSITLPIILVAVIELAIFINLGIPHLMGESLPFITPICISTIQLGATVDYAILMTTRYKKERYLGNDNAPRLLRLLKLQFRQLSLVQWDSLPLQSASHSTRMLTLFHQSVSSIARGAVISMFCVTLILPAMFMLFDKVMQSQLSVLSMKKTSNFGGAV